MVQVSGKTTVRQTDVREVVAALPLVLDGLRGWTFDEDGLFVTGGVPRSGLRLVAGTHPHRGAKYRATVVAPDAAPDGGGAPQSMTFDVELQADDDRRFTARCVEVGAQTEFVVEVVDPREPTSLTCVGSAQSVAARWWGGRFSWHAETTLPVDGAERPRVQAEAKVVHPRFRVLAVLAAQTSGQEDLRLILTIRVRGRGILRLLTPFLGPLARRPMQRAVDGGLARIQAALDDLGVGASDGPRRNVSALQIADAVLSHPLAYIAR